MSGGDGGGGGQLTEGQLTEGQLTEGRYCRGGGAETPLKGTKINHIFSSFGCL